MFAEACQFLQTTGVPDETCFPYGDGSTQTCSQRTAHPCTERCSDWETRVTKITDYGGASDIKNELMNGPLMVGITVKEDYFYYNGGDYTPILGEKMNHVVSVCGWTATGQWICKDSWGQYRYTSQTLELPTWITPEASTPKIAFVSAEVTEPNNQIWDIGEQVNIVVTLRAGNGSFSNVQGTLTTTDANVTIDVGSANFGNISEGSTANNSGTPLKATATGGTDPRKIPFTLHVTSSTPTWSGDFAFDGDIGWIPCGKVGEFSNIGKCPYGMAYDGTNLCVFSLGDATIFKLSLDGSSVGTIPTPENDTMCLGGAYDPTGYLWVSSYGKKKIYKVNPANGSVVTSFPSPAPSYPTGLAYDGTTYLYAVDRNEHKIYKCDTQGNPIDEFDIPIAKPPLGAVAARGIAFEPNAPDGGSLILYYTWFSGTMDEPLLDSTCIYELTKQGEFTGNKCTTNNMANGRLVCANPIKGTYWVDGGYMGPIQSIKGFYPPKTGVEEEGPYTWIRELSILPNPSQHKVDISFHTPEAREISIKIYDVSGKLVYCLVDKEFQAGNHKLTWDGSDKQGKKVSEGIYFIKLKSDKDTFNKKVIFLH